MKSILLIICVFSAFRSGVMESPMCGVDNTKASMVYEGIADIKDYPWMGTFYYKRNKLKITTSVVLITAQFVLGSASEIDKVPKDDIRERSRVILGKDCEKTGIKITDYTFHPDYRNYTESFLVIIQLDVDIVREIQPICPPPAYLISPEFYAMTTSNYDCKQGKIQIRKMEFVDKERCTQFYRKYGMDVDTLWPSHTVCARALSGDGECKWRSGTALVIKQDKHWRLLGFGLSGPGCQLPSRFLDYGMHESWVRNTVLRIGKPAITRLSDNSLIMRRSLSTLQRYGPCDAEETKYELYTDRVEITSKDMQGMATYNVTLVHGVEYSCIVFRADYGPIAKTESVPRIHLRRWCAGPPVLCYDYDLLEIHFFVEIKFSLNTVFSMAAYGKKPKIIEPRRTMVLVNLGLPRPFIPEGPIEMILKLVKDPHRLNFGYKWFFETDVAYMNPHPKYDSEYMKKRYHPTPSPSDEYYDDDTDNYTAIFDK